MPTHESRTAALARLAEAHPWVVAPAGRLELPLTGALGALDFLLDDPVARAVQRGFWTGTAGELLWVSPVPSPLAGMLLVGTGREPIPWDKACEIAFEHLPVELPGHPEAVAVLPPAGADPAPPLAWPRAAERFVPVAGEHRSYVRRWIWFDLP